MKTRILICGLPGSGKTTLASALSKKLTVNGIYHVWFNADMVRKEFNDWDFSEEGRLRQANRMKSLSCMADVSICDFVCPTKELREVFQADYTVWVNTLEVSRFADTDKVFQPPTKADLVVSTQAASNWSDLIFYSLRSRIFS